MMREYRHNGIITGSTMKLLMVRATIVLISPVWIIAAVVDVYRAMHPQLVKSYHVLRAEFKYHVSIATETVKSAWNRPSFRD